LEKKQGEWTVIGDPIEGASIAAARKARLSQSNLNKLMPKLDAIPFESKFEYMASLHVNVDDKTIYLKGSLEAVLSRSGQMIDASGNIVALDAKIIVSAAESMIEEGLLVIAFAKKLVSKEKVSLKRTDLRRGFIFLGLQGINQIV
jgi:Ca2+-transporting ATPase